jgi:stearoyl-CoA desaturase (delta-9 desaturase)
MENVTNPVRWGNLHWLNIIFLTLSPLVAIVAVAWHALTFGITWVEFGIFFFWYFACGLAITVGYHRLYAHRSHEAALPLRILYAAFGAGAFENSILEWCSDHRLHHKETDNDTDPYDATKGFLWSHVLWMVVGKDHSNPDYTNVRDLEQDWVVRLQHRFIFPIGIVVGMVGPAAVGYLIGGVPTAIGGLIWGGLVRTVFVHHGTFLINSAAHVWGKQPYTIANTSKDSGWLAFLTFGEGYHNFHHAFQADYRNGIKWWQWDPSKWWISAWSLVKFNSNLKRTPKWSIEAAKMKTRFARTVEQSESIHDEGEMSIFESRCKDCIGSMRDAYRSMSAMKRQLGEASAATRKNIANQIDQSKQMIKRINSDFQRLLDEMMQSSTAVC